MLRRHSQMREEVYRMTKPLLKLPSMILDELQAEIADRKAEIADQQALIANQKSQLADKDAEIMSKDAEIRHLRYLVSQLSAGDNTP